MFLIVGAGLLTAPPGTRLFYLLRVLLAQGLEVRLMVRRRQVLRTEGEGQAEGDDGCLPVAGRSLLVRSDQVVLIASGSQEPGAEHRRERALLHLGQGEGHGWQQRGGLVPPAQSELHLRQAQPQALVPGREAEGLCQPAAEPVQHPRVRAPPKRQVGPRACLTREPVGRARLSFQQRDHCQVRHGGGEESWPQQGGRGKDR